eukprot:21540-Heterococcus_DN1.PRE.6
MFLFAERCDCCCADGCGARYRVSDVAFARSVKCVRREAAGLWCSGTHSHKERAVTFQRPEENPPAADLEQS